MIWELLGKAALVGLLAWVWLAAIKRMVSEGVREGIADAEKAKASRKAEGGRRGER